MFQGKPLFSWIDINLTELCNRKCIFCPRIDSEFYPNQPLHMSLYLVQKIADELESLNYTGAVVLCGYGEPLLHPSFIEVCRILGKSTRLEVVTNGDHLKSNLIRDMQDSGVSCIVVSMYDGPEQVEYFKAMFDEAKAPKDSFVLRDRWHTSEDGYGLKLTNRAGTVTVGEQPEVDIHKRCFYPHYSLTVDWNGDALLCVQDWNKKVKFGNLAGSTLTDVWFSKALHKYRIGLGKGRRTMSPCDKCNADGVLHGFNHVEEWQRLDGTKKVQPEESSLAISNEHDS